MNVLTPLVETQAAAMQPTYSGRKDVTDFWHFIFDGSGKYDLQNKEKFEIIYNKVNSLDKGEGKLLKEEFEKMYK